MALTVTHTLGGKTTDLASIPMWQGNLLQEIPPPPPPATDGPLACWSGWTAAEADPATGRFPVSMEAWGPSAWQAMLDACREVQAVGAGGAGGRLLLRPHARHILSDAQRCLRLLETSLAPALLLEPAAMLTESMLPDAAEHLERMLGALAGRDGVWGLVLSGVEPAPGGGGEGAGGEGLRPCPLTRGVLAPEILLEAAARWFGPGAPGARGGGRPVVILAEDAREQLALGRRLGLFATVAAAD